MAVILKAVGPAADRGQDNTLPILENPVIVRDNPERNEPSGRDSGTAMSRDQSRGGRPALTSNQQKITDNLGQLLDVLPPALRVCLDREERLEDLQEIVLDLGRPAEARLPGRVVELAPEADRNREIIVGQSLPIVPIGPVPGEVTQEDIDYVTSRIGDFGQDNRAGIERTLHRISAIRNRRGRIVGLTCRIGRAVYGTVDIIRDIVEQGKSILMLGRPGVGKTTKLREMARILSDEFKKRVVIVDTSNEIAGDGDIPHPAIGRSRRMQVRVPEEQHAVMIEAVENHMPQVIVIDEIGTEQEAFAARTIAERGVQLIGTAHGNSLENLLLNPTLSDLVGGIQSVTLGDEEAKRRGTQKTVLERKAPPTFDVIIEILEVDKLAIHHDVARVVDKLLRGQQPRPEIRVRMSSGEVEVMQRAEIPPDRPGERSGGTYGMSFDPVEPTQRGYGGGRGDFGIRTDSGRRGERGERGESERIESRIEGGQESGGMEPPAKRNLPATVRIFPYGVSRSRLERAIANLRVPAYISKDLQESDVVIALKATFRRDPGKLQEARNRSIGAYVVKSNTYIQIENVVREVFGIEGQAMPTDEEAAIMEAEEAIESVIATGESIELTPQNSFVRRLQHQMVESANLLSESVGVEPKRRIRVSRR
ncbi:MAG: R3H domain-containing nucleic acid-binding protein [Capsulimonadales bacterium]|nr:R3H domain-containing nucleic acid-binding protein [Capsulimonadales bacterium]